MKKILTGIARFFRDCPLAAERFLRDHGRPPATLEELVPEYLPEVPRNPFTGDPLKLESGRLSRLLPGGELETFEGFRIYGGGAPSVSPPRSSSPVQSERIACRAGGIRGSERFLSAQFDQYVESRAAQRIFFQKLIGISSRRIFQQRNSDEYSIF